MIRAPYRYSDAAGRKSDVPASIESRDRVDPQAVDRAQIVDQLATWSDDGGALPGYSRSAKRNSTPRKTTRGGRGLAR